MITRRQLFAGVIGIIGAGALKAFARDEGTVIQRNYGINELAEGLATSSVDDYLKQKDLHAAVKHYLDTYDQSLWKEPTSPEYLIMKEYGSL